MSVTRPHASGSPPYWPPGAQIMWRYRGGLLGAGTTLSENGDTSVPHYGEPVTVVRDDAYALVAWLAAGTPVLRAARVDGRDKRDDKSTLFTAEAVQEAGVWTDYDVLRIAQTGRSWSAWAFFTEHTNKFTG